MSGTCTAELLTEQEELEIKKALGNIFGDEKEKVLFHFLMEQMGGDPDIHSIDDIDKLDNGGINKFFGTLSEASLSEILQKLRDKFNEHIIGQEELNHGLLMAIVLNEHCLLEGLPGVGKTEVIKWIGHVMGLPFCRIQFIPDMLPSDLLGKDNVDIAKLSSNAPDAVRWVNGPIFSSLVLADEINRAPSKVQAALLECMGEKQVTAMGKVSRSVASPIHQAALELWPAAFGKLFPGRQPSGLLDMPVISPERRDLVQFNVLATMNPIEQEGTYPLSEAQTDRFCFKIIVPYPARTHYDEILGVMTTGDKPPEAIELKLSVEKMREYFRKYPRHMIPVLLPLYFLLKCRAHIIPVKIEKGEKVVENTMLDQLRNNRSSRILEDMFDIVYMTNARATGVGESQGSTRWYDKEQIEMRSLIMELSDGADAAAKARAEKFMEILHEDHSQYVKAGASVRGFSKLVPAVLCDALINGTGAEGVSMKNVLAVVNDVLRHRIHMEVHARLAGITPEDVIHKICEIVLR